MESSQGVQKNLVTSSYPKLQVTQKQQGNILVYPSGDAFKLRAVELTDTGESTSERWTLFQSDNTNFYHPHRVSADDRLLLYSDFRNLFLQRLGTHGLLQGEREAFPFRGNHYFNGFTDADASNAIIGNKRIIAYSIQRRSFHDEERDRLYTRIIDAATLKPAADPVLVRTSLEWGDAEGGIGPVCMDPFGRFLLYVEYLGDASLVFQSVDVTGHRVGSRKILALYEDIGEIDLLKD